MHHSHHIDQEKKIVWAKRIIYIKKMIGKFHGLPPMQPCLYVFNLTLDSIMVRLELVSFWRPIRKRHVMFRDRFGKKTVAGYSIVDGFNRWHFTINIVFCVRVLQLYCSIRWHICNDVRTFGLISFNLNFPVVHFHNSISSDLNNIFHLVNDHNVLKISNGSSTSFWDEN